MWVPVIDFATQLRVEGVLVASYAPIAADRRGA